MRNKPLKNKAFELNPNVDIREGSAFWFTDVKQAVQGLLEEIDGEKIKSKLRLKYSYNEWHIRHERGYQEAMEDSIDLIKKWFPDVV